MKRLLAISAFGLLGLSLLQTVEASGFIQSMQLHEKAMRARGSGDIEGAIQAAEAELAVVENQLANDPMHMGRVLPFLGELYLEAKQFSKAEQVFARALVLRIEEVGSTSGDVAGLRSRIAQCKAGQGQHEAALSLFEQAVAVYESKGKDYDLSRASTLELSASVFIVLGRVEEAAMQRALALKLYSRTWGEDDPRTAEAEARLLP